MKSLFAFVSLVIFSFPAIQVKAEPNFTNEPKAIRVTPPAPKFTDAERQTELARR